LGSEFDATEFPEVDIHHSLAELPGDHLNGGCKGDPSDLLDVAPQLVSAGNPTIFVAVRNKEIVDRARLDVRGFYTLIRADSEPLCVFVFAPTMEGAYSRMFAPLYGISEDPATGNSTGPLASFMMRNGLTSGTAGRRLISEQGNENGAT
jgi:trans-2,3-dihydro-3-hydroxyanthranilate isomerase